MQLPLMIKSHYYKGLLVLSRRDRVIDDREKHLLLHIGKILDFDRRYCEATIDELLSNRHISREPVIFSEEIIKECFFRDALRIAYADGVLHPSEMRYLQQAAQANGWPEDKLNAVIREIRDNETKPAFKDLIEIQRYIQILSISDPPQSSYSSSR